MPDVFRTILSRHCVVCHRGGGGMIVRYPVTQDQRGVNGFDHQQYGFALHASELATKTKHRYV